jgi:hypothetical protein
MVNITFKRATYTPDEIKEVLVFARNQETTDKYICGSFSIDGDFAKIAVTVLDDTGSFEVE